MIVTKRVLPVVLFFFVFALVSGSAWSAGSKVGFVNATKVVEESPQYATARKKLEKEFSRRNKELGDQQKQLKKLEEKLERDGSVMSESELKRLERDIIARKRKLKNATAEFREDFTLRRNEEINKLRRKVSEVVREVGKAEKIDLIVSDGVVYFSDKIDISGKVLERLKRDSK